ncbi:hypothetical protein QWY31_15830 [Cytophagales bacterium LB-30]|uniref:Uncharacterized protein n=1 Tax=Shiella aurantiaca TaxID=3058365 RepID=A0ABT8F934_9BACT|nr:hypothetical protein [Shiella aurantiaca]MDN4166981.1 hypothetical protein [Shiella aurantiaca]
MNIPLANIGETRLTQEGEVWFSSGADLSMRYYPWRLLDGKIYPFVGVSFNTMKLLLEDAQLGERAEGFIATSALAGLSYSFKGWRINAEWMFLPKNDIDFYSNTRDKHRYELPNSYFSIGLVRHFDFTLGEEGPKRSGKTKALEEMLLGDGKLNSISVGFAPNGAHFLKSPSFSGDLRSLPNHKGSFNFEYSIGYLLHKQKLHFGLTYRTYSSNSISYGWEHVVRRQALSMEGFKFVANYHGFVPFVGLSLSAERWATGLFERDIQQDETVRSSIFSPGIIFGWDIQPSSVDSWVLRTNLRYYPNQKINDIQGKSSRVDQFEFNFIQFVFYPNRWWNVRQAKRSYEHG